MLGGQGAVFLSCSEKYKTQVAYPLRDALAGRGLKPIIVSDEPMLARTEWSPDAKVDRYLDASDAFVALCTPDDELAGGTIQCRPNITDEIQRARSRPHLRERIAVLKAPDVRLPSNINPTYEHLDPLDIAAVVPAVVRQLEEWGVLPTVSLPATSRARPTADVADLLRGLSIGDDREADLRAYSLITATTRGEQERIVGELVQFLHMTNDQDQVLVGSALLESLSSLDRALVDERVIESLAFSGDVLKRMCAANLLWDRAANAPADVPLGILGRLAQPAHEDWYVQAPAMAAAKTLLLHRLDARAIFDRLASSSLPEDRFEVAVSLLSVADTDPVAVPKDLVEELARDSDPLVAAKANEVLNRIGAVTDVERHLRYRPFVL